LTVPPKKRPQQADASRTFSGVFKLAIAVSGTRFGQFSIRGRAPDRPRKAGGPQGPIQRSDFTFIVMKLSRS